MTSSVAFIFPGQGSQAVGMTSELHALFPEVSGTFAEAAAILSRDIGLLCFEGPEEELTRTINAQPALFTASVATHRLLTGQGLRPGAVAGHSLGEYSALVAAGALSFAEGLELVRLRGELMEGAEAGTMAAILGLEETEAQASCDSARAQGIVQIANLNCPGQIVISGEVQAVEAAMAAAKERGAKAVKKLRVGGAFHSPLMNHAAERMAEALRSATLTAPLVPVVSNVSGQPSKDPEELRRCLLAQMTSSVLWDKSVRSLASLGLTAFVEVGPGKVLTGLVKRIAPEARALNVEGSASLKATLESLALER